MKNAFQAVKITEKVYWVGAIDWTVRDFHGYATSKGSTYNAYLILADKVTLIDTVKAPFKDEFFARIASVIDPLTIDVIVSNHSEMDHSGLLPEAIRLFKPAEVYASAMGVKALNEHFHGDPGIAAIKAVKSGDSLSLGNMSLEFLETKLLHWPDSMFSYLKEAKLLFSQDGFGMHLASGVRFADQIPAETLYYEAAKYYANILLLYSDRVLTAIEQVISAGYQLEIIAPDHGPVWRQDISQILEWYKKWAVQKPASKAIVTYDSMWKSTETMARAIGEGLISRGIEVKILPLSGNHRSDVVTELLEAGALVIGSPTMNNNLFPTVADLLCYVRGLKPLNLLGFAFGSYGWSGEALKQLDNEMAGMGVELTGPALKCKYVPTAEVLVDCFQRGVELAEQLKAKLG